TGWVTPTSAQFDGRKLSANWSLNPGPAGQESCRLLFWRTTVRAGKDATLIHAVLELSAGLGSSSLAETMRVLAMVPTDVGVARMVIVATAPLSREPTFHVRVPPTFFQVPVEALAEMKDRPVGRLSSTATLVAGAGP